MHRHVRFGEARLPPLDRPDDRCGRLREPEHGPVVVVVVVEGVIVVQAADVVVIVGVRGGGGAARRAVGEARLFHHRPPRRVEYRPVRGKQGLVLDSRLLLQPQRAPVNGLGRRPAPTAAAAAGAAAPAAARLAAKIEAAARRRQHLLLRLHRVIPDHARGDGNLADARLVRARRHIVLADGHRRAKAHPLVAEQAAVGPPLGVAAEAGDLPRHQLGARIPIKRNVLAQRHPVDADLHGNPCCPRGTGREGAAHAAEGSEAAARDGHLHLNLVALFGGEVKARVGGDAVLRRRPPARRGGHVKEVVRPPGGHRHRVGEAR